MSAIDLIRMHVLSIEKKISARHSSPKFSMLARRWADIHSSVEWASHNGPCGRNGGVALQGFVVQNDGREKQEGIGI